VVSEVDFRLLEPVWLFVFNAAGICAFEDVFLGCGDFVELFGCDAEVLC
jgi:hypothetical protein